MIIDYILKFATSYDLFIFDINGVLDNNHDAKVETMRKYFPEISDTDISNINIDMERAYESNKSSSTSSHISSALADNGIIIDKEKSELLADSYFNLNRIKTSVIDGLNKLAETKKVYLYTALSRQKVKFITSLQTLSDKIIIFAKEDQIESKPSIRNLQQILKQTKIAPEKTILFGDNVAVDLMPANLLGIKSILASNYVDDVIKL